MEIWISMEVSVCFQEFQCFFNVPTACDFLVEIDENGTHVNNECYYI